jgi:hypothetical protein
MMQQLVPPDTDSCCSHARLATCCVSHAGPVTVVVLSSVPSSLLLAGIPHSITANGNLTRNGLERIAFLAKVIEQCVPAMPAM